MVASPKNLIPGSKYNNTGAFHSIIILYDCHLGWQIMKHPNFRDVKKFLSVPELKKHVSNLCKTSVFYEAFRNSGCSLLMLIFLKNLLF